MDEFSRRPVNRASPPGALPPSRPLPRTGSPSQPAVPRMPVPRTPAPPVATPPVAPAPASAAPLATAPRSPGAPLSRASVSHTSRSRKKVIWWSVGAFLAVLLLACGGIFAWYTAQLAPVDSTAAENSLVTIAPGSTPSDIATLLKDERLIQSPRAFLWYTRLQGVQGALQAGTYRLSPAESTQEIVAHLTSGKVDTFNIRFLPGGTVADARKTLISAGYTASEVDSALNQSYNSPLFAGKPAGADLEGYIYGETYTFATDTPVERILEHIFDEYYRVIQENRLTAQYTAQGLTLYQGITLASIIQREASPSGTDMPQIAQVFYTRLATGMPLGSDVTYQYIADKTGVPRSPNLDSPYNTRRYAGLPPGPIATPGVKALRAVAQPAKGDYLYFLSGDDDVTYFGRTLQEHEANIANHCQKKCQIL